MQNWVWQLAFGTALVRASARHRWSEIRNLNLLDSSETIATKPWMCSTNTINVFIVSVRNVKYGHRIPAHWQRVSELNVNGNEYSCFVFSLSLYPYLSSVPAVNPDLCTFDGNPVKFDFVSIPNGNTANVVCVHATYIFHSMGIRIEKRRLLKMLPMEFRMDMRRLNKYERVR